MACADYRLSGEAPFPAQLHDVRAAVRWLVENAEKYNLDPERIGAYGQSAGGHLAALLGTAAAVSELSGPLDKGPVSHRVRAVVAWFAPLSLLTVDYQVDDEFGDAVRRLFQLPDIEAIKSITPKLRLASPVSHVSEDDPPHMQVHGAKDNTVPWIRACECSPP